MSICSVIPYTDDCSDFTLCWLLHPLIRCSYQWHSGMTPGVPLICFFHRRNAKQHWDWGFMRIEEGEEIESVGIVRCKMRWHAVVETSEIGIDWCQDELHVVLCNCLAGSVRIKHITSMPMQWAIPNQCPYMDSSEDMSSFCQSQNQARL